ncbi:response regulator transcription factor [Nocardiopsis dassonvillei]|uniref:Two component transcriptional regulator, LuxR family n=1 Tax=Nocardiopsis dassonvillei (strain ATCC 23218 / DSM 43111 / CIP 107115 / JCM 7437 / KCTC 9190 / NBRC 14626 / NCTC 10488 / NRRL B-5397 / IMRU 509) TaxID=446468 RepID=D7B7Z7_NOCDD|nr:response regulator transcription factor [Nocardiopsis dassonvillei]ADH70305.1 two component transcriptional regulator, LuxR family [Nocardiopsis dassonvillei subsp. dassonvillei DSM 43111]NKY80661.1 response regulator transcription factor [Nocardiopsis dassonvillei]VEI91212.1 Response regulator protein vraR [Nocardiopsis dassonvillei]
MIRVLIADDHPVVRDGLRGAFTAQDDIEVVGEAANGREAVELVGRLAVDVVLMDLRIPVLSGVGAIAVLSRERPDVRVLVLTTFDSESDVLPAIEAGATGYLLKDASPDELLRGVRAVHRGESVLAPTAVRHLMGQVRRPAGQSLSDRELQVLGLVADGASNRAAAARLFISEASIKTHLQHVYNKLGVRDRAAAVAEAYRRGLLG